jgi:hypothetical protein
MTVNSSSTGAPEIKQMVQNTLHEHSSYPFHILRNCPFNMRPMKLYKGLNSHGCFSKLRASLEKITVMAFDLHATHIQFIFIKNPVISKNQV